MPLPPGLRLGPYELSVQIGAGGMGEVYRATDTNLKRTVAVKVLPRTVATDPDRLARFQREAEVLASLNHANIAAIYGLERTNTTTGLVMELVEGRTLADRIAEGPIPVDEAVSIAKQIAAALDAAHEKGIVHRDLKPANVKVRPDGAVKVLDFGLAKALDPVGPTRSSVSDSPTITSPALTAIGVLLGTAAYMSPEQARAKFVDKRTDVWAFGAVFYEMLAGRRAFPGDDVSDVIASVLTREPDCGALPVELPPVLVTCIKCCLHKDRKQRIRDIGDVLLLLDGAFDASTPQAGPAAGRRRAAWLLASALVAVTAFAAVQTARLSHRSLVESVMPEVRLEIPAPAAPSLAQNRSFAPSPDGLKVVYSATVEGRSQLWLRPLSSSSPHVLMGTDRAVLPFWSPDSRSIGFFADGQLKRLDIDGGTIRTLTSAPFGVGGTWNAAGTIVFAPIFSGPLYRISAHGGEPTPVTQLAGRQGSHRAPQFLPDGRHFLFAAFAGEDRAIYLGDLHGAAPRRLVDGEVADVHQPSHRLLFLRQGTIFSQPCDDQWTPTGTPTPVAERAAAVQVSRAGPIVYRGVPRQGRRQFVWFDRSGREIARVGDRLEGDDPGDLALSPNARFLALSRTVDGNTDIWVLEIARGVLNRFTSDPSPEYSPRWSPDGKRLSFTSLRSGVAELYVKSASGGPEELLLSTPQNKSPSDWSPDGRFLLFRNVDPVTSHDLWVLPLGGDRRPFPVVRTRFVEATAQFSPDGQWIAYESNETGGSEVYAQPFPGPGSRVRISTRGGAQMRWRGDGQELFYLGLDGRLMAAQLRWSRSGDGLVAGEPVPLFQAHVGDIVPMQSGYFLSYVASPDGQRFLVNTLVEEPAASPVTVLLNWNPRQ